MVFGAFIVQSSIAWVGDGVLLSWGYCIEFVQVLSIFHLWLLLFECEHGWWIAQNWEDATLVCMYVCMISRGWVGGSSRSIFSFVLAPLPAQSCRVAASNLWKRKLVVVCDYENEEKNDCYIVIISDESECSIALVIDKRWIRNQCGSWFLLIVIIIDSHWKLEKDERAHEVICFNVRVANL